MVSYISFKQTTLHNKDLYKNFYKSQPTTTDNPTSKPQPPEIKAEPDKTQKAYDKLKYISGGILIGASTVGLVAICCRGKLGSQLRRQVQNLQKNVDDLSSAITKSTTEKKAIEAELSAQKKLTEALQAQLDGILETNPKISENILEKFTKQYRTISEDLSLNYNPMNPMKNGKMLERDANTNYVNFRAANLIDRKGFMDECINPQTIFQKINELKKGDSIKIPFLQESEKIKFTKNANASLQPDNLEKLGKLENCDKAVNAGITARWDEEKIARDLLQNFYDGHGHTLDGVNMIISKTKEGKYKVRIEGKSTYNCEYIAADGLSTKSENLADAGGFGEGLKMVNVSMLAKKLVKKITYGSMDWKYDITANSKFMQRKLDRVQVFDGNFVEFEVENEKFLEKIVNATNFFEHSKNPDFRGLNYENADMGFAFLGKNKKGNLYLTQRFAYDVDRNWENSVDGLNIFFRKKPDAAFSKGRDRTAISNKDLAKILDNFVQDIPKEKALDLILDMQSVWASESGDTPKAYKILLEALCNKFSKYTITDRLNIDLTKQKFVAISKYAQQREKERLVEYGYTLCDECLENIGMPNATQVLNMYSAHTPLQPTTQEIKKIKLLGEAVSVIAEQYKKTDLNYIANKISKLSPKQLFVTTFDTDLKTIADSYPKLFNEFKLEFGNKNLRHDVQIVSFYSEFIADKLKNIKNCTSEIQQELIKCIEKSIEKGLVSEELKNIFKTKNLLIKPNNPKSPVFVFDRHAEKCKDTLAEAMIDHQSREYLGHWVSRDHLNNDSFTELLATWLHETLHQYAGDSDAVFGYKLTDLLGDTFKLTPKQRIKLHAIQNVFNEIK